MTPGKVVWTFFPFSTLPAPCSIVWCRFPYVEDVDKPGPKPRPSLIKRASEDQDGNPWVHVTYGTTKDPLRRGVDNFSIVNLAEMDECGLWKATRFRLDRVELLPWAEEFFINAPNRDGPVMGRLSPHLVTLLRRQAMRKAKLEEDRQGKLI